MVIAEIILKLLLVIFGFIGGIITAFAKGWVDDWFTKEREKRNSIEKYMAEVTDLVAIATSAGYNIRLNNIDKRRILRVSFQLERLGKKNLAHDIRSYLNKWSEVFGMYGLSLSVKDERRRLDLIKELDVLTDSIMASK